MKGSRKCSRVVSGQNSKCQREGRLGASKEQGVGVGWGEAGGRNCGPDKNLSAAISLSLNSVLYFLSTTSHHSRLTAFPVPCNVLGRFRHFRLLRLRPALFQTSLAHVTQSFDSSSPRTSWGADPGCWENAGDCGWVWSGSVIPPTPSLFKA